MNSFITSVVKCNYMFLKEVKNIEYTKVKYLYSKFFIKGLIYYRLITVVKFIHFHNILNNHHKNDIKEFYSIKCKQR